MKLKIVEIAVRNVREMKKRKVKQIMLGKI